MRHALHQVSSSSIDEFRFVVAESASTHVVSAFIDWLAEYIATGAVFVDGQTLQYGFSVFFCRVQSRTLTLLAPDFSSMPIAWVPDLGPAFDIVALHKYTPETFGLTPDIPSLRDYAIVGERFDELPMFADRTSPSESNPNDSGWFIGSPSDEVDDNNSDTLRPMSLYQVVLAVPQILQYLSLPVGCRVSFSGGNPMILKDGRELHIPRDSYLDRLFHPRA